MVGTADPYYNRKPVPDDLIKDVGLTNLTAEEEYWNRERKYSANGVDVRKFSNSKKGGMEPQDDPYYGRKQVTKQEIQDEYWNRERKYSVNGVDVRRFSTSKTGGMEPQDDPYYGRKQVSSNETHGIGETNLTPAEAFEVRERKQSLFQLSSDPFDVLAGRHRQSVSGVASSASADASRRRSSAAGRDAAAATASHNRYQGDKLEPIASRPEGSPANGLTGNPTASSYKPTTVPIDFDDPDAVAPDERR